MTSPATYNIDDMARLLGCTACSVRRKVEQQTIPKPMRRTGKTAPFIWQKSVVDKFLKIPDAPAANDANGGSFDALLERMIEQRLAARIEQLRAEIRQEMSAMLQNAKAARDV